jgi:hypothetical protein
MLISLGMGIDYGSTPSYTDYLKNELSTSSSDTIRTFATGVEFFGGFEYRFAKTVSARLDYSYYLRSNTYTFIYYVFDYTINSHQPYLMIFYHNLDKKFSFKIGAGAGFHFHNLRKHLSQSNSVTYKSVDLPSGEVILQEIFRKAGNLHWRVCVRDDQFLVER